MSQKVHTIQARHWPLWFVSWFVWKLPGKPSLKMAGFSHTERGSGHDMLEACEQTERRDLRLKYFRHAADELKHSRIFTKRAKDLSIGQSRAQAVLQDSGFIQSHGIRGGRSLFEQLGELEFLAFVWVAEKRAVDQFGVYIDLMKYDQPTIDMFHTIGKDEFFHVSYSKAELERYRQKGQEEEVKTALWRVRRRRWWQAWLRGSRVFGDFMSGLMLSILYLVVVAPFAIIAKITEGSGRGFMPVVDDGISPVRRARMQA